MTSLRKISVLVTGGTGFIGSILVERLLSRGARVHLLVRASSKPDKLSGYWKRVKRHIGDLTDGPSLKEAVRKSKPDSVGADQAMTTLPSSSPLITCFHSMSRTLEE